MNCGRLSFDTAEGPGLGPGSAGAARPGYHTLGRGDPNLRRRPRPRRLATGVCREGRHRFEAEPSGNVSVTITRYSHFQHAVGAGVVMVRAHDLANDEARRQAELRGAITIDAPVHRCLRCPAQSSFAALSQQRLAELEAERGRECRWLRTLVAAADIPLDPASPQPAPTIPAGPVAPQIAGADDRGNAPSGFVRAVGDITRADPIWRGLRGANYNGVSAAASNDAGVPSDHADSAVTTAAGAASDSDDTDVAFDLSTARADLLMALSEALDLDDVDEGVILQNVRHMIISYMYSSLSSLGNLIF